MAYDNIKILCQGYQWSDTIPLQKCNFFSSEPRTAFTPEIDLMDFVVKGGLGNLKYDIAERVADNASLKIFDIRGRQVAELYKGSITAGSYEAEWNPGFMPSGTYFAKLTAGNFTKTIKLVLTK